jgi:hypothetical protein
VQHKSIHLFNCNFLLQDSMQPIERENRQNGNQESSQETSQEGRQEGRQEEVTADSNRKATHQGDAQKRPLGAFGPFCEENGLERIGA